LFSIIYKMISFSKYSQYYIKSSNYIMYYVMFFEAYYALWCGQTMRDL